MILGVYWYFEYPTDLYTYDYFKFGKGYGGHADNPASLETIVKTAHPERVLEKLQAVVNQYEESFLYAYQDENILKIGTGSHQLFDYDFLFMKEVEKILKKEEVILCEDEKLNQPKLIRFENKNKPFIYPKKKFLQLVGSSLKKQNAETMALRMDCNIVIAEKNKFISAISATAKEENIDVLYYLEKEVESRTNLMLFFTNGRQGKALQKKQYIDILSFEDKMESILEKYPIALGHIGGFDYYPKGKPTIVMKVDEEYIIG
ncbi:hypothetical protein [Flavobacterium sp. '19STA2R22 D10 B1']|uniref:hypothetical protein n=1 Tax=Flavobacterium aerium TaxID=3037261 RepID=UPI00278C52F2|nr:hypothetical protein [Flavobacterium sp. '19STA2R22 D10 B1']